MSTLDSLNDDVKSNNQFMDFTPNKRSKFSTITTNNFNKKYGKILNDFNLKSAKNNDFMPGNVSNYLQSKKLPSQNSNRTFSYDDGGEKLKLKAIQSQLETQKENKKEFSTKLKDIKLDYFTKNNNSLDHNNFIREKKETTTSLRDYSKLLNEKNFQKYSLISDKMKIKIGDFIKRTNEFSMDLTSPSGNANNWKGFSNNKGEVKNSLMKEFKLFDKNQNTLLAQHSYYSSDNVMKRKLSKLN
jgi:hypothetical protein